MKYFLDTEFIEAPNHLDLISIGIVAEDGRELYGERSAVDWSKASQWVLDNVQPHLSLKYPWADDELRGELRRFVGDDPSPDRWICCCGR